jgi:hypothetical protein
MEKWMIVPDGRRGRRGEFEGSGLERERTLADEVR